MGKWDSVPEENDFNYPNTSNPFFENGKWYWFDEASQLSKPYETEKEAKKDLEGYLTFLGII